MPNYPDSTHKIIDTYFAAITKTSFTYRGKIYEPRPLRVYKTIVNGHICPPGCGACCLSFTLDYLPEGEPLPHGTKPVQIEFNGSTYLIQRISPLSKTATHCQFVDGNARCTIHEHNPLSCDFEPIRIEIGQSKNYNTMGVEHYGRRTVLPKVNGVRGTLCDFTPPTEQSIADNIRKLKRLQQWANYFGLTETYLPDILRYIESEAWKRRTHTCAPAGWTTPLRTGQDLSEAKAYALELIEAGSYTRQEITLKLVDRFTSIKKGALGAILTDAKNPKIKRLGRLATIDQDGVWKFD